MTTERRASGGGRGGGPAVIEASGDVAIALAEEAMDLEPCHIPVSRVWARMAGMSEARKFSPSPSPTTSCEAFLSVGFVKRLWLRVAVVVPASLIALGALWVVERAPQVCVLTGAVDGVTGRA